MWFQKVVGDKNGFAGFWMCPTPNCDGKGFTFDIFPTDPDHPANEGWSYDDEDEEFDDDEEFPGASADPDSWDPEESKYKRLDEELGDEDDDITGEEWKYGLEPGADPPEPPWAKEARQRWEQEQARYDQPDERPRELDWSNREDEYTINDDDIPF
jgi:hypothetical protein